MAQGVGIEADDGSKTAMGKETRADAGTSWTPAVMSLSEKRNASEERM